MIDDPTPRRFCAAMVAAVLLLAAAPRATLGQAGLPGLPQPAAAKPAENETGKEAAAEPALPDADDVTSLVQRLNLPGLWEENSVYNWATLLAAIFLGLTAGKIASALLRRAAQRIERHGWRVRAEVFASLAGPINLAALSIGLTVGLAALRMSPALQHFWSKTLLLLYSIAVAWYVFNLVAVVEVLLSRVASKTDSSLDRQLVPLIRKTLRIFIVVVWITFVVDSVFNQNIGAWLAGLGIAGLAISLAAQDSLKNLFGSITILLDRPFQVGERIIYAGYDGMIEEIGFRSTKVRTFAGHLVSVPNSIIVNNAVENVGRRPYIRRILNVTITYDTPKEKIVQAVEILRNLLEEDEFREPIHQKINGDEYPPRVFFDEFNPDSLNIKVIYWYAPPAYWDYLDHAQRLNLRIFEEYDKAGIEFAFPTQTLYLAGDPKRDLVVQHLNRDLGETRP